ncbi:GH1 family beta-glucosidase [Magnetospirillum sp. UT-4]|uniref:GH1 family beta-glucosidase n=1 Tax=Magnetospirillum sp. UT-4 TaxID=2681467 RepID=UPI00137EA18F|nr:GH1 family beta-glucosidase [Magnetospirillum sp. UT-4]CAA7614227.1 Beta-glucosidase A [Magnetospirillum sp. UT-4]
MAKDKGRNGKAHPLGVRPDFVWGASTSAYQIEGAAFEDGRGPSIWDVHCRTQGRTANGDTGDVACDHYHRYKEDVALMKTLGVGAYRFSVSWPRVLPRGRGAVNAKGLDFYDRLIDEVLAAGITPWLCLYHWDLPQRLHELGGWTNRDVAGWFADYTTLVARRFGDRVKHFATFNEPNVCTLFGYAMTWCAPAAEDRAAYLRACHHVNLAHGAGVDVVRDLVPGASIGCVYNLQPIHPADESSEADRQAADQLDAHWNRVYADPHILGHYPANVVNDYEPHVQAGDMARICRPMDWVGINHYGPIWAKADADAQMGFGWADVKVAEAHPEIGWEIFPEAFTDQLMETHARYGMPIYITENGCGRDDDKEFADDKGYVDDFYRVSYLKLYTAAMAEAIRKGADVRGYFIWSLLDNFEWGSGYGNRFGIIRVDFPTGRRFPKKSFKWYADTIKGK